VAHHRFFKHLILFFLLFSLFPPTGNALQSGNNIQNQNASPVPSLHQSLNPFAELYPTCEKFLRQGQMDFLAQTAVCRSDFGRAKILYESRIIFLHSRWKRGGSGRSMGKVV